LKKIKYWDTSKKNIEQILEFLRNKEIIGIGVVQRLKYIYSIKTLLRIINKNFDQFTERDLENFILGMGKYKPKTKHIRWYCVKKFFEFIGKKDLYNNLKPSFKKKGMKLPEELLTEEEVKRMVEGAYNIRDKALIAVLFESGCRIGELLSRKIKHVVFDEYGAVLIVDGKTGMRRIRLVNSVPLLANWIANHPRKNEPECFLWINMNDYKNLVGQRAVAEMLSSTAKRVGINKKIYCHLFRHSKATHLAKFLTEQELKVYFGWTGGSDMASIYVHLSGKDVENKILEINGIKNTTATKENITLKECIRCKTKNDSSNKYCSSCGMILDDKEAFDMRNINPSDEFHEFLMDMFRVWKKRKEIQQ
jgi:site-specific recombinase XerD